MSDRPGHVCGEVNGRGRDGAYGGYRRFIFDKAGRTTVLDQGGAEPPPPNAIGAACAKPTAYQSVDERFACADVQSMASNTDRPVFEKLWGEICSAEAR